MKNKHSNFRLILFVALIFGVTVFTTCKKAEEEEADTGIPVLIANTNDATKISQAWATINGMVNAKDYSATISFEYGTTTSYEHSIVGYPDTVSGSISTDVWANITGLTPSTEYHFRVVALSSDVSTYGYDYTFTTLDPDSSVTIFNPDLNYGSISDSDGNNYKTIEIGTQTWMAENLKTTKYNDGTLIPRVVEDVAWKTLSTPGYCWSNNISVAYGAIYNWYTVNTGKLCPTGWHIPTDAEWTILTNYLDGGSVAGDKLKETGTTHWSGSNSAATNESGFTALPGGYRNSYGTFSSITLKSYWWSSTENSSDEAYYRALSNSYSNVDSSSSNNRSGFYVRCLQDY